ncbi:aspartate/glutamate racemase family protein [Luteolibacter marinus]|uniref:aspartate/glutamate racemase family protein n=1 Tax=Luteolibacter marinus TaxID=2776705 RepID=UPI001866B3C6|nr:amino acid racemase [Luteolibacter marinus]
MNAASLSHPGCRPARRESPPLRKFGLIGGTSWRSTMAYYSAINEAINRHYGDNTNPRINLASLDQKGIHSAQLAGRWEEVLERIGSAAIELQHTGVEGIALCANTPHKIYDLLQSDLRVPVLHIGDAIARECERQGWTHVGLLGTRFTMEDDFLRGRLKERYGIRTRVPNVRVRRAIHRCLLEKLSMGIFDEVSRRLLLDQIDGFSRIGVQAVILGCTEFPLLLAGSDSPLPQVDSLACHCDQIVEFILGTAD